jgi:RNA polymerase sigma factor (sigma-70 family)
MQVPVAAYGPWLAGERHRVWPAWKRGGSQTERKKPCGSRSGGKYHDRNRISRPRRMALMAAHAEPLLHHLQRLLGRADADSCDDAALLQRFVARRDETAFAALLARHGPMVLGVCRRILRDDHEAEDVFQAVFLLFARKANNLRHPKTLAAWLYGVARRLALMTQRSSRRRRQRENAHAGTAPTGNADPLDELSARELLLALDEELARLPERYRLPLILCGLEGRSQAEAARLLGWTAASVRGRLERGRTRLRSRLLRRGLTLGASLLAMENMTTATVSAALRHATVQKAQTP